MFTKTLILVVTVAYVLYEGVNVRLTLVVPAGNIIAGSVNVKRPVTFAAEPLVKKVTMLNVCPYVTALNVGGVSFPTASRLTAVKLNSCVLTPKFLSCGVKVTRYVPVPANTFTLGSVNEKIPAMIVPTVGYTTDLLVVFATPSTKVNFPREVMSG